jgi:hypothetical protein
MEIRDLMYLETSAAAGNFTRAAKSLGIVLSTSTQLDVGEAFIMHTMEPRPTSCPTKGARSPSSIAPT